MAETDVPQPITATPRAGQAINHNGKIYTTVKEGLAYILTPPGEPQLTDPRKRTNPDDEGRVQSVFYNPIQQFNRDLSVLAIKAFGEDIVETRARKSGANFAKKRKKDEKRKEWLKKKSALLENAAENASQREVDGQNGQDTDVVTSSIQDQEVQSNGVIEPNAPLQTSEIVTPEQLRDNASIEEELILEENAEEGTHGTKRKREPGTQESVEEHVVKKTRGTSEETAHQVPSTAGLPPSNIHEDLEDQGINDSDLLALDSQKTPSTALNLAKFSILDALSATGLRAIRYAHEIPFATSITANDLSAKATALIEANVQHNNLTAKIHAVTGNALAHMYSFTAQESKGGPGHRYDVIDLDPYGTAAPFIDAAVQALNDGGLLCVTCTDAGVFNSSGYPEKTYSQYGGLPLKGVNSHEGGLRLILHSIATSAARYGMAIEPLLSLSIDYYARVFVRVRKSPAEVKFLAGKTILVYNCDSGCGAWTTQLLGRNSLQEGKKGETYWKHGVSQGPIASSFCQHCGFKTHMAGPMYGGPIHNPAFVQRILDYLPSLDTSTYGTTDRIEGMLTNVLEESSITNTPLLPHPLATNSSSKLANGNKVTYQPKPIATPIYRFLPRVDPSSVDSHPFFFKNDYLARVLHCVAPSEAAIKGALRHLGYRAVRTHVKPGMIKTDAPWSVIWRVMREWVRTRAPVKEGKVKENMAGWKIMQAMAEEDSGAGEAEVTEGASGQNVDGAANGKTGGDGLRKIVFDEVLGRKDDRKGLVRYQLNPRANWGPMARAK